MALLQEDGVYESCVLCSGKTPCELLFPCLHAVHRSCVETSKSEGTVFKENISAVTKNAISLPQGLNFALLNEWDSIDCLNNSFVSQCGERAILKAFYNSLHLLVFKLSIDRFAS